MNTPSPSDTEEEREPGKREAERLARRQRLLDSAERLFADMGYDATGLRDITTDAGTRLASVTEEFGGKEQLFQAVLARRALPLEHDRLRLIDQIPAELSGRERLDAIVAAFIDPMLGRADEAEGWRNYFRFVAQLANSRHIVQILVATDYNRVARHFMYSFGHAYPNAADEDIHDAYLLMLASTLEVFAVSARLESLSEGRFRSTDLHRRCRALRNFVAAGVEELLDPK